MKWSQSLTSARGPLTGLVKSTQALIGPKYDGQYLRKKIRELLGNTKLSQTLTNVAIPCFDIKKLQPVIFSTLEVLWWRISLGLRRGWEFHVASQVKNGSSVDVDLADVCIGTSAAPTFLPAHHFTAPKPGGAQEEFNLIDGAVAANNPV